ncbi:MULTISPECIES: flagellar biosynthesis regulator FlaF [Afifella]|uniref:flagellar biosynthesis regulator FlaF n=1 Tax=Afifella TaxID=643217 RepID=UPI000FE363C8|nr:MULTISPECIES: flagellar biosynthesis regulator FlaF [Afifella]MCT8267852.1 flagellar biosynthesis regulator FlaF [Afifella sp. JA880]
MYKFSYAEILDDSGGESRAREQMALDHALELLHVAEIRGAGSPEAAEALGYVNKLWNFMIRDLASPQNGLGQELRRDLISVGLWVIREAENVLVDPSRNFAALIEVNQTIRDGLK